MWYAHRWAGIHVHGLDLDGLQADHCCPAGPSTLCVQHVQPETLAGNRLLQSTRPGRAFQDLDTRRYWIFVQKGIYEDAPIAERMPAEVPFYTPPAWLRPYLPVQEISDECPF